mgnify:CR=1 FL=1|tara:strand:- start:8475 stop:9104 length:630 start_codon:yes stop_codon:yes gene_type:complete
MKNNILLKLNSMSYSYGNSIGIVCSHLLEDDRFSLWSGSAKSNQHHYGDGGLMQHTYEVICHCFSSLQTYDAHDWGYDWQIDKAELFLAALFHDSGKMYDYEWYEARSKTRGDELPAVYERYWQGTEHKRLIHHISRSALIWTEAAKLDEKVYEKYHEKVLHAILAHHGQRSWGSPVAPKTRVAWLLHLCDGISARMYDADTSDVVEKG